MEIRFFAPGNLVSNLDFVESIFGNGGDPFLPENDAGLDAEHWTGHTGCVILAPHLTKVTKKDAGLPHWDQATERQRRDGMCWKDEWEFYNDGQAFKLTCRDEAGVIVTIIADNYFGYCKKEVKTQISYAANLFGLCEEEHAGGALVFPSYDLGEEFSGDMHVKRMGHTFAEVSSRLSRLHGRAARRLRGGQEISGHHLRAGRRALRSAQQQRISWPGGKTERGIKLLPGKTYVRPSGYKVRMEKPGREPLLAAGRHGRRKALLCHKPCTVSGGGKSEISKPITDAILTGPVFVADFKKDFDQVAELIRPRLQRPVQGLRPRGQTRRFSARNVRSVPSSNCSRRTSRITRPSTTPGWKPIPQHLKELVFVVKRYYKPEWGENWREHFSVDIINGTPGNELKCDNRKLVTTYLRVGFDADGAWRTFGLRKDFHPAVKIQMEDDITASVVVPADALETCRTSPARRSLKFVQNCEARLFQRPDDAIHRGYDKQTETDFARPDNFFSNYEPLTAKVARELVEDAIGFYQFTEPMQKFIREVAETGEAEFLCLLRASAPRGRQADQKSALPPDPPRPASTRAKLISPKWPRACAAACRRASRCYTSGRRRVARPPQQSARTRHPPARGATTRFITSNCRSCSWNSFAA